MNEIHDSNSITAPATSFIHPVIREFCVERGIPESFAAVNFEFLDGDECIERMLCAGHYQFKVTQPDAVARQTQKRLGYLNDGAIWFRSLDPEQLEVGRESEGLWAQCRPITPRMFENGKLAKYESPAGVPTQATIFRMPGDSDYWERVMNEAQPVVIVEGPGKAAAVMVSGHPAIALPGVWNAGQSRHRQTLIKEVEIFLNAGCPFIIGFDNDTGAKTRRDVAKAIHALATLLEELGADVQVAEWPRTKGSKKGAADDLLAESGIDAVRAAIERAVEMRQWRKLDRKRAIADREIDRFWGLENGLRQHPKDPDKLIPSLMTGGAFSKHLRDYYGDRLKYNIRTLSYELDGEKLERLEHAYLALEENGWAINRQSCTDAIVSAAQLNKYDPVKDDLDRIVESVTPIDIEDLATKWFGTGDNQLYNTYIKKFLISMVARVYDPGCKVDTVLILKGEQGQQKSKFWRSLTDGYFADDVGDLSEKDQILKAHRNWLIEWAEIDSKTSSYHAGKLKNQISVQEDLIRLPYARDTEQFPRNFCICGSTNAQQILHDETGDRRYWVIDLPRDWSIPTPTREEREAMLAGAVRLWKAGEQWWLTKDEEKARTADNEAYRANGQWYELIAGYLDGRTKPTYAQQILEKLIGKEPDAWTTKDCREIAASLKACGWEQDKSQSKITLDVGKVLRTRLWRPPASVDSDDSDAKPHLSTHLSTPQTLATTTFQDSDSDDSDSFTKPHRKNESSSNGSCISPLDIGQPSESSESSESALATTAFEAYSDVTQIKRSESGSSESKPQSVSQSDTNPSVEPKMEDSVVQTLKGMSRTRTRVRYVPKLAHLMSQTGKTGWIAGELNGHINTLVQWDEGPAHSVPTADLEVAPYVGEEDDKEPRLWVVEAVQQPPVDDEETDCGEEF